MAQAAAADGLEVLSEHASHGGVQGFYRHRSVSTGGAMKFSAFRPPGHIDPGSDTRLPALIFLAGLTCTEETFAMKAHAQRAAARLGILLIAPDTSPRGTGIPGADADWDLGHGAGFYLDATRKPWAPQFAMESYVVNELRGMACAQFGADPERIGIFGHSMGGHGALTLALRHPGRFASVSAFAPICAPTRCAWGEKAFTAYLGADHAMWRDHDASELMTAARTPYPGGILVDQGLADKFLATQLMPDHLEAACAAAAQPLTLRRHAGYDHSYYFIATFIDDHLEFHARQMRAA